VALEVDVLGEDGVDLVLVDVLDPYFRHRCLRQIPVSRS
jgi:hypothetical protein